MIRAILLTFATSVVVWSAVFSSEPPTPAACGDVVVFVPTEEVQTMKYREWLTYTGGLRLWMEVCR